MQKNSFLLLLILIFISCSKKSIPTVAKTNNSTIPTKIAPAEKNTVIKKEAEKQ